MKLTKKQLKRIIKEEIGRALKELSAGEVGGGTVGSELQLQSAIYKRLRDGQHTSEKNPLSLSALLNSVDQYLKELGLDERGIKSAKSYFRRQMGGGQFMSPDGDLIELVPAQVLVGPSKGERGLYLK